MKNHKKYIQTGNFGLHINSIFIFFSIWHACQVAPLMINWLLMSVFRKKMKVSNVISVENFLQSWKYSILNELQCNSDYMRVKMFICHRWILLVDHSSVLETKIRRRKGQSRRWRNFGVGSNWTLLGKFAAIDLFCRKSII